jgi:hypothetical protein
MNQVELWALGIGVLASVGLLTVEQAVADDGAPRCTRATLKGRYLFAGTGPIFPPAFGVTEESVDAAAGIHVFNGDGTGHDYVTRSLSTASTSTYPRPPHFLYSQPGYARELIIDEKRRFTRYRPGLWSRVASLSEWPRPPDGDTSRGVPQGLADVVLGALDRAVSSAAEAKIWPQWSQSVQQMGSRRHPEPTAPTRRSLKFLGRGSG